MAWTAPRTWVTNEIVTAAIMNTHIRDNQLEGPAATASAAGAIVYADAANSMGSEVTIGSAGSVFVTNGTAPLWREATQATGNDTAISSSSSTTYSDLDDAKWGGTNITITANTGTKVLVLWRASLFNDTGGQSTSLSYRISGATTSASADSKALRYESGNASDFSDSGTFSFATVTQGSNTFTLQGKHSGGTGNIRYTRLYVMPLS